MEGEGEGEVGRRQALAVVAGLVAQGEAGHGRELAAAILAALGCIAAAGFVVPWRLARARSVVGVVRGALGAGLLFLGFAILQATVANASTLAQSYAFWLDTRGCVDDVAAPQASARLSPPLK